MIYAIRNASQPVVEYTTKKTDERSSVFFVGGNEQEKKLVHDWSVKQDLNLQIPSGLKDMIPMIASLAAFVSSFTHILSSRVIPLAN